MFKSSALAVALTFQMCSSPTGKYAKSVKCAEPANCQARNKKGGHIESDDDEKIKKPSKHNDLSVQIAHPSSDKQLDDIVTDIMKHGFLRQRQVRILKASTTEQALKLFVLAQDENGQPTTDLAELGFTLSDGSRDLPFEIGDVVPPSALKISMVMDYSRSMGAALSQLEEANVKFYHSLPSAQFSVVKFSDTAEVVAPMAIYESNTALDAVFTENFPTGNTALYAGILRGLETHQTPAVESEPKVDTLSLSIVFTDGIENVNLTSSKEVVTSRLRNSKIPQIILGMGEVDIKTLLSFAENTNGIFQYVADGDGIESAMTRVTAFASSIIPITIPLPPELSGLIPERLVINIRE